MSPPLAATETKTDAKTKVRRKKTITPAQLSANRRNARLSRGPVTQAGKECSRVNTCTHNMRAEIPILPGEDSEELYRRLSVWPGLLGAQGEIECAVASRCVHTFWRIERSEVSEDSEAEKAMIAVDKELEEREAEEVRQLEAQIDSHEDPKGVVRKLKQTPTGCRLLIQEFQCLRDRMCKYGILFWSQRTRLFHLLGKREGDLFTDDPVIVQWMASLMSAAFGDTLDKLERVSDTLDGLRPVWMEDVEYAQRMQLFVAALPCRDRGLRMVVNLVDAAIADLKDRLEVAQAQSRYERALACKAARVDDSPAGARRLSYKMRHDGSFHAAMRRLDTLKRMRWAGLTADTEEETETTAPEPAVPTPAVATTSESPSVNHPISPVTNDPIVAETSETIQVATTNSDESGDEPGAGVASAARAEAEANDREEPATATADPGTPLVAEPAPAGGSEGEGDDTTGVALPMPKWAAAVPLSACRRADSFLNEDAEESAEGSAQVVDYQETPVGGQPSGSVRRMELLDGAAPAPKHRPGRRQLVLPATELVGRADTT